MKKLLVFILIVLLTGCSKNNTEDYDLSIVVPSGAPSLAFYNEINNDSFNTGDAQSILPQLKGENGADIIVIDTVNGIKTINDGGNYKLAATITFGNFYIASTGKDDNGVMENGDYIVLFSQNATPDLVFHNIYGNNYDSNVHYVSAVSDASACLIKGINIQDDQRSIDEQPYVDYVMIAEPALSAAMSQNSNARIYANIQEEYAIKNDGMSIIQASVFVSNKLNKKQIDNYLNNLENNINSLLENPELFEETTNMLSDVEIKDVFGVPNVKIVKKVLNDNSIGLGFVRAYDNKNAIDKFISLFGLNNTDEEIYYK